MPTPQREIVYMKIGEIDASEKTRDDCGDLSALAQSIRDTGLLNPIIVEGATKKLVTGYRRLLACKMLKLEEIKVTLFETLSDTERRLVELQEEIIHKKNRSWQEEVALKNEFHTLMEAEKKKEHGPVGVREKQPWNQQNTADLLGIGRTSLSEDIRLAEAMKTFPELASVVSKSDARRKMYRLRELALMQELARRGRLDPLASKITFVNDDCREALKLIKENSIDLIITDPPWGIGLKELAGAGAIDYKVFRDDPNEQDLYKDVIPQLFRVLKEGCHLYLFFAMERYREILNMMKEVGFDVREQPMVWVKDKPGYTAWEYKPMPQYESIFFAVKNTQQTPRRLKEATTDVLMYARPKERIHITEKPVELLKRLIFLSSDEGDIVMDPFAGSGSTLMAALLQQRRAVGMERDKETFEWALGRLKAMAMEDEVEHAPEIEEPKELTDDEIAMQSIQEIDDGLEEEQKTQAQGL